MNLKSKTVTIQIAASPGGSIAMQIEKKIRAVQWAIENAPTYHIAPLIGTKSILEEIRRKLI